MFLSIMKLTERLFKGKVVAHHLGPSTADEESQCASHGEALRRSSYMAMVSIITDLDVLQQQYYYSHS